MKAVVVGGSFAGLTAAAVLAPLFDQVTLCDRDNFTDNLADGTSNPAEAAARRRGVPQFRQPHILLLRGLAELEGLFPGFRSDAHAAGATPLSFTNDILMHNYGQYGQLFDSELVSVGATRGLLEQVLRQRVMGAQLPNLRLLGGAPVDSLRFDADTQRVTGVQLQSGEVLEADLVVDASGRNSPTAGWLAEAGWQVPEESKVTANLGYATRFYHLPADYSGLRGVFVTHRTPPGQPLGTRGGLVIPVENNMLQVILYGYAGDHPGPDEDGFLDFAASLAAPDVYDLLAPLQPATPVARYLRTDNRLAHYEKCPPPEGLVLLGDAVCAFNPVFGQGMTVGIVGAVTLGDAVRQRLARAGAGSQARAAALAGLPADFQKRLAGVVDLPWSIAVGEDIKYTGAEVKQSPVSRALAAYFAYLARLALSDKAILLSLSKVAHLLAPPSSILAPGLATRALRYWLAERLPALAPPAPAAPSSRVAQSASVAAKS